MTVFFIFSMYKKNVFVLIFFLLWSFISFGQNNADTLQVELQSVDVNAFQNQLKTGRLLTVIGKETIDKMPVQSLDDLLETISGVDIRQRGVGGTQSDVSIRGGSFDQVLVLLNGINITDPQTGHYNLDVPIDLSDISRVEILQGSAARIYGPNAFSGAINIITNVKAKNAVAAKLTAGSYNTFSQNISGNVGNEKLATFASFSNKSSQGYIPNTDYKILNAFSQTTLSTNNVGKFDLQLAYQQKSYGANAFYSFAYPNQFDHTQTYLAALNWNLSFQKFNFSSQVYLRKHYDRFELFRDSIRTKPSWYSTHNYHVTDVSGAKVTGTYLSNFAKSTFGLDLRNEHIYSNALGTSLPSPKDNIFASGHPFTKSDNRLLLTAYADFTKNIERFNLAAGASTTYNDHFGWLWSGGTDVSFNASDNLRFYTSVNSAVRLPTFTDLYLQNSIQKADPLLMPEKSTTFDLGIKYEKLGLKLNGTTFYRIGKNVIDWVKFAPTAKWESKNLTDINAFGVDASTEYELKNKFFKNIGLSYSYLSLNKQAIAFDSKYALDYLRHKLVLSIYHNIVSMLSAQWKASYNERAGDYVDFISAVKTPYNPFFMVDLRLVWTAKYFDVFADGNNLLNVNYADYGGLVQPGFNYNVGIRLKLQ